MTGDEMIITPESRIGLKTSENCPSGIIKIACKVLEDIRKVIGCTTVEGLSDDINIVCGILDVNSVFDDHPFIERDSIKGKNEVYGLYFRDREIIVAGSDKRGTIYGLFKISEILGVSPLVSWSKVEPPKKESVELTSEDDILSKEPSVKYRGFFINDEWPAFGTWCMKHYGGVNAEMYESVFELLLRLKGNYLWPAMWASCFALDGPGLRSAELADEYGVIMGLSHHEPCLRHGEEYSRLRGKDSIYGDAWDFRSNREGITRFWADGLKRNGRFENVITVGMRGERDSTILGREATLADNISLLRDVIKTQNELIAEYVDSDLKKVPRMLALYKEVEPYYYGDEENEGLCSSEELEDVILMLCDDNHGHLRTLPDEKMRSHKGGFGMYYHFDYHGDPISYEWVNSTYLPVVWEQMTTCYESGVNTLWIVNVGDLALNEMPLCYFLDLAYDYGKWGISNMSSPFEYTREWADRQFGSRLDKEDAEVIAQTILESTRLLHNRRPEHMNDSVFGVHGQARRLLSEAERLRENAARTEKKIGEDDPAFTELVSYNVQASLNLLEMWIYSGFNRFFSEIGAVAANVFGEKILKALEEDDRLTAKLHSVGDGAFDGFGLAPHIGFRHWNSEEMSNPVLHKVIPVKGKAIKVGLVYDEGVTSGLEWTGKELNISHFETGSDGNRYSGFFVACCGDCNVSYTVECDKDWIRAADAQGRAVTAEETVGPLPENAIREYSIIVDREKLLSTSDEDIVSDKAVLCVKYENAVVRINVYAREVRDPEDKVTYENGGIITVTADRFSDNVKNYGFGFALLRDMGRNTDAVKVFPVASKKKDILSSPYIEYKVFSAKGGDYDITFELAPNNPYKNGRSVDAVYGINGDLPVFIRTLTDDYKVGSSAEWAEGVLEHVHYVRDKTRLKQGVNTLRFYGVSPETVLERIVLKNCEK